MKSRDLTQSLKQIRVLYNKLQNNQENETKKITQRMDNIEKGVETNKEEIAKTKDSVNTVCAGIENLQIIVPKLEERVATVENTNSTIVQMLKKANQRAEKAEKRAEEDRREQAKDKEDIH